MEHEPPKNLPHLNHRSLYADDPSMRPLIAEFLIHLHEQVRSIHAHRANANAEELRRVLHQLKGSGLSYGFPHITAHASAAEESIAGGQPLAAAVDHLHALIDYIEHIDGYAPI